MTIESVLLLVQTIGCLLIFGIFMAIIVWFIPWLNKTLALMDEFIQIMRKLLLVVDRLFREISGN